MMMQLRMLMVGVALAGVAVASAQSFAEKTANVNYLTQKAVQTELGVTEELRAKMNKFAEDFNKKANTAQEEFQKKNPDAKAPTPELIKKIEGYKKELDKNVLSLLSKAQVKRLSEITLQVAGYPAMMDPTVGKEIGLTEAQMQKLRDSFKIVETNVNRLIEKEQAKIAEKYKNSNYSSEEEANKAQAQANEEISAAMKKIEPELAKIRNQWLTTMKKTVKAIQLNKFDALMGKPFKPQG